MRSVCKRSCALLCCFLLTFSFLSAAVFAAAHEHQYEPVEVVFPTCTTGGYTVFACTVCGDRYEGEQVPAKGHKWSKDWEYASEESHEKYCTTCGGTVTEPHSWALDTEQTIPATEEYGGLNVYVCTGCNEQRTENTPQLEHVHYYMPDQIVRATCTQKGSTTYVCYTCGDTYVADIVPALGHDWDEGVITKAPTCTSTGMRRSVCRRDSAHIGLHTIPALGHAYEAVVTPPGCTEEGYTTYACTRCGDSYRADVVPTLGSHVWDDGAVTTAPTCTGEGVRTFACLRGCGATYTAPIPAAGHTYSAVVTAPTCTETGITTHVCTACGDTYTTDPVPALGHNWDDGTVTTAPTCTEAGVRTFACLRGCGAAYTEPIPAAGHTYSAVVTAPTCTENGFTTFTCATCGDNYTANTVSATGHDWSSAWEEKDEQEHSKRCANGCGETQYAPHSWIKDVSASVPATEDAPGLDVFFCVGCGRRSQTQTEKLEHVHNYETTVISPTCTEDGFTTHVCAKCGDSYRTDAVPALGHDWDDGAETAAPTCTQNGTKTFACRRCSVTRTESIPALEHSYVSVEIEATCTQEGYVERTCSRCSDSYRTDIVPARGHDWDDGAETAAPSCTQSGVRTFTCSRCSLTRTEVLSALGHAYETAVTLPSCTGEGFTAHTCSRCGDSYRTDVVPASGHDWNDGEETAAASCTQDGMRAFCCLRCGETRTEPIRALGHAYSATVTPATCTTGGKTTYLCDRCGDSYTADETAAFGHAYEAEVTSPTCTTEGYTVYICRNCADVYTAEETAALGHDWDDGQILTAPTCVHYGQKVYVCRHDASHIRTEAVAPTGHDWDAGTVTSAPTCVKPGQRTYTCRHDATHFRTETIPAAGHSFGEWARALAPTEYAKGLDKRVCIVCGTEEFRDVETLPPTVLTLDKTEIQIRYKQTESLTASEPVTWSTNDPYVRMDAADALTVRVTGLKPGTAILTASSIQGGKTVQCIVRVRYEWWQLLIRVFLFGWIWY